MKPAAAQPQQQQQDDPDKIFKYDEAAHKALIQQKPWEKDVHYFKNVKFSATALIKMVMHARSGGDLEVMGLLQGKLEAHTFVVMDSFALPVVGSETRVNPGADAMEYIIGYLDLIKSVGKAENAVGWYHSHPGYGCWLSGIDVSTQMLYQQFQEPWLAVVIDPKRTINGGKVELGAFRTYPKDYKAPEESPAEYQSIPLEKIEDFGVHCKQYYQLETTYFKSALDSHLLDLLWNKYWISTLSSSPILANREFTSKQLGDLAEKLESAETSLTHGRMAGYFAPEKKKDDPLAKIAKDCARPACEQIHGLISQVMKEVLFNARPKPPPTQ